jgi:hypothetical protein
MNRKQFLVQVECGQNQRVDTDQSLLIGDQLPDDLPIKESGVSVECPSASNGNVRNDFIIPKTVYTYKNLALGIGSFGSMKNAPKFQPPQKDEALLKTQDCELTSCSVSVQSEPERIVEYVIDCLIMKLRE